MKKGYFSYVWTNLIVHKKIFTETEGYYGFFDKKKKNQSKSTSTTPSTNQQKESNDKQTLKTNLQENLQYIKDTLGESSDIIIREICIGKEGKIKAGIIYTDGLSDAASLQNFILETLMLDIKRNRTRRKSH